MFQLLVSAQSTFNAMHPMSIQQPPYNYTAHGSFFDAFEIDESPNFFDGFLVFGRGVLRNPGITLDARRGMAMKVNTNGDLMYQREYNHTDTTAETSFGSWFFSSVVQDHNSNYRAIMTITDGLASHRRYLLTTDLFGDPIENVLIDSIYSYDRHFTTYFDDRDSTIILGLGDFPSNYTPNLVDYSILWKLDTLGNTIWKIEYNECSSIHHIEPCPDGGYYLSAGNILGYCDNNLYWDEQRVVIRVDENGEEMARWTQNGYCNFEIVFAIPIENNQIVVIGKINPDEQVQPTDFTGDIYSTILQYQDGEIIEVGERKYYWDEMAPILPMDARRLSDESGFVFTGAFGDEVNDQIMGFLAKIDNDRELLWARNYIYFDPIPEDNNNAWHYLNSFKETSDGGYVAVGYIEQRGNNPNPLLESPWIVKVDEYGCLEPGCQLVNVDEIVIGLENTMSVFPNPVSDVCTIEFNLQNSNNLQDILQKAELTIFDLQGKEIMRINLGQQLNGNQLQFSVSHLASGMYLAHLTSEGKWLDSLKIVTK